jgi:hypothetical protein
MDKELNRSVDNLAVPLYHKFGIFYLCGDLFSRMVLFHTISKTLLTKHSTMNEF